MLDINTYPIIICCNIRTGSTALADMLAGKHRLELFSEPIMRMSIGNPALVAPEHPALENFKTLVGNRWVEEFINKGRQDYIVKFIAGDSIDHALYRQVLAGPGYKIRLYRRNKIDQILSYYIANETLIWHQGNHEKLLQYNRRLIGEINEILQKILPGAQQVNDESEFNDLVDYLKGQTSVPEWFDDRVRRIKQRFKQRHLNMTYEHGNIMQGLNLAIEERWLAKWTDEVARQDMVLKHMETNFDVTLAYEDLGRIDGTIFDINQNPENIDELRAAVEEHLLRRTDLESSWMV
jgi:LPS sulfotransferase NodH